MKESTRLRLLAIAAAAFWLTAILNIIELATEGSSVVTWITMVLFLLLALYYTYITVMMHL